MLISVKNGRFHKLLEPVERTQAWRPTRVACGITITPLNYFESAADADRYTGGRLAQHFCAHCKNNC